MARDACTAVPPKTLSRSCGAACPTSHSCLIHAQNDRLPCNYIDASELSKCYSASNSDGTPCTYQCFAPYGDASVFRFHVAFNRPRQDSESSAAQQANSDLLGIEGPVPYEMNEYVQRIDALTLEPAMTEIVIVGGQAGDVGPRGKFVSVAFDPLAFASAANVKDITLQNIDLHASLSTLMTQFPTQLQRLDLANTNVTTVPLQLGLFTSLTELKMAVNYVNAWPFALVFPSLERLDLRQNNLTEFTADLPSLSYLDLTDNQLTSFPSSIFTLTKLRALKLRSNPRMAPVAFSAAEFELLSRLEELEIDASALDSVNCDASQLQTLPSLRSGRVCVLGADAPPLSSSSSSSSSSSVPAVLLIIATVAVVLALLAAFVVRSRRRHAAPLKRSITYQSSLDDTDSSLASSPVSSDSIETSKPASKQIKRADSGLEPWMRIDAMLLHRLRHDKIQDERVLANGSNSTVWLVRYAPTSQQLAAKRLRVDKQSPSSIATFVAEIQLAIGLEYPRIVPVIGVAWSTATDLQVLYEYMPGGDLQSYLATTTRATGWESHAIHLAIDIAEALVYTHSFQPPLLHRNLTSRAVLLSADYTRAKLSKFGSARYESETMTKTTVGDRSVRWLAPEILSGTAAYTASSDVYSLGVILSELDTRALPYDGVVEPGVQDVELAKRVTQDHLRPLVSSSCPPELKELITRCLDSDAGSRPTPMVIAFALRRLQH